MATRMDLRPGVRTAIEFNTYQVPAELGIDMPPQAASCVLDITEDQFLAHLEWLEAELQTDARRLAAQPDVAAAVRRLPVPRGGKVIAIGDSVTTYRRSYAELLRALLALCRPDDGIQYFNRAQSGFTSTHVRRSTYMQFVKEEPDLVLILLGGNDCERFGEPATGTLVSLGEYRENMEAIVTAFQRHTSAQVVLLSPLPVIPEMVARVPDFARSRVTWHNTDLQACADTLRGLAYQYRVPFVDLMEAFGPNPDPDYFFPDGVHPGPNGEEFILEHLLQGLM